MNLPRFTIRRLMMVVGLTAAILAAVIALKRRAERFFYQVILHSLGAANSRQKIVDLGRDLTAKDKASLVERAEHHGEMRLKYRYAARHPWLPVALDLPIPPGLE